MKKRNEKGALIIEASIVFPIMFLVIFFMIYAGNVYLQRSRVESIVNRYTLEGAAYCADPMLDRAKDIPSASGWEVYPYRAFSSTGVHGVEGQMEGKIRKAVSQMGSGLFEGMDARACKPKANYKNNIICSNFTVDVTYEITMPIRLLGQKDNMKIRLSSHASAPVSDTPELIRNVDMIQDYAESSEFVDQMTQKINAAVEHAKSWFNS